MGHESPERAPERQRAGHASAVDARSVAAPSIENQTLDALTERVARANDPVATAATLRPQAVQRLQLRAGNAAVAAMLQRRAAPAVRRSAPPARKAAIGAPVPVARAAAPTTAPTADGTAATETVSQEAAAVERSSTASTIGIGLAGAPPPTDGLPLQRSLASMIEEARRKAAPPSGPEDTKTVEGDTDLSEYTDAPAKAAEERKAIPPPPPPPLPATPGAVVSKTPPKPPPMPAKKRIGKALVAGPRPAKKATSAKKAAPAVGEIVKKPAPPLPPPYAKVTKAGATLPPPPAPPKPIKPHQDPGFSKVATAAKMTVKQARKHPSGGAESAAAQAAAVAPGNDIDAQAKANRVDTMATAKPKPFDENAFVLAVEAEMRKSAPKNLSEAGDVEQKSGAVKDAIGKKVTAGKDAAGGEVEAKAEQPPDPSTATPKPVTPMTPLELEQPGGMQASGAMPAPVPNEQVDFRHGPAKVDGEMAEAGVSEKQLAESNEPEFTGALDAKKEGEANAQAAPAQVRKAEAQILKQATIASAAEEKQAVGDAKGSMQTAMSQIAGKKGDTKSKDELKRKEVADHINSIFDTTKQDVEGILGGLETTVDEMFTEGEAAIRKSFTDDWKQRLGAYKSDRYSGLRGKYRWVRDKFKGLPAKANQLFEQSKAVYERDMQKMVRRIAQTVSAELNRATVRIEQGRGEVATYVGSLKGDLAKFGQEAATDMADKFDSLDSSVKDKFDDLAGSLAKKYSESQSAVAEEIEAAQAENRGLIDKAVDAVKGVIKVISQLKDLILNVLTRIAGVVGDIIASPITFLKNFVTAVKGGITRFMDRIGEHLQKGLMGWLFGTLDAKGIEIPDSFSLEGIMKLVMSVLGMTWDFVKERLAKKIGEPAVAALIAGADIVKKVVTGGPAVLWEMVVDKFTEFQDMVVGEIKNFVIEKVVKSGITFLISLMNPAAAFIKACKMIYDVVMFFVERGSQIKEFVDTLIDTAGDIAKGGGGGIPEKIEGVLAKLLPLAISFLANILGLGGVGDKVRSIIDKVRNPIHKAMDKVIDVVVKMTAPIWKPAKKLFEKGKKLYGKAKDKVVKKYEDGKAKVKEYGNKAKDYAKKGMTKVKDTATSVKDRVLKLLGFPRTTSLSMGGEPHTLSVEKASGGAKVTMASAKGDLLAKIAAEARLAEAARPKDGARIKAVANLANLANKVLEEGKMAVGARDEAEAKARVKKLETRLKALKQALVAYGRPPFSRTDLGVPGKAPVLDDSELKVSGFKLLATEAEAMASMADEKAKATGTTAAVKKAMATVAGDAKKVAVTARKGDARVAKSGKGPTAAELAALRKKLDALRAKLGVKGNAGELYLDDLEAGICGEVGRHQKGHQGARGRTGPIPELFLESEHVIPRDWINNYLMHFHNRAVSDDFYHSMTTVMLYKSASNKKTYGNPPAPGNFAKNAMEASDNETAKAAKKVIAGGSDGVAPGAREALLKALPKLLTGRIEATMTAIEADRGNAALCATRKKYGKPLGASRAQVEMAATRQLHELQEYIRADKGRATPAGSFDTLVDFKPIPFKMGTADHTLTYTPPGKLEMASVKGPLVKKLEDALTALQDEATASQASQVVELRRLLSMARRVEEASAKAEKLTPEQLAKKDTPPALRQLQKLLATMTTALDAYAGRWKKKDLPKAGQAKDAEVEVDVPNAEGKTAEDLKGTELYRQFGMPTANALYAMKVAARFNVVVLVRPTNPTAPVLLERGLVPKPEAIKAKTINTKDVVLGGHAGITEADIGKVGWFEPRLPPEKSDDYLERYVQRLKEQADEKQKMAKLLAKKRIEIVAGKIVDKRSGKEITGDHDLYAVLDAAGRPMVDNPGETAMLKKKEAVVAALRGGPFNAQHGAHLDWKPKSSSEQRIFDVIVQAHQGGEPLLKITASGCTVTSHKPEYLASGD